MSASRFTSLSAATRQWLVELHGAALEEVDTSRRRARLARSVEQGYRDGELQAVEYLGALLAPAVAVLDRELTDKLAAKGGTGPADKGTAQGGTGPADTGTAQVGATATAGSPGSVPPQKGPLAPPRGPSAAAPGTGLDLGQAALLPLDLIHRRRIDIAVRIKAVQAENKRLRDSERDSRDFRKLLQGELEVLQRQYKDLTTAERVFKEAPGTALERLATLGIDAEALGLGELAALFEEAC